MAQRWPEAAYDAQHSSVAVAVAEWVAVAVMAVAGWVVAAAMAAVAMVARPPLCQGPWHNLDLPPAITSSALL